MIYKTYELYKQKYYETQQRYNAILNEKEKLFALTQPKAVQFDKERVHGGAASNSFDDYLVKKEQQQIDQRLSEVKAILEDRERLFKLKEMELRESTNIQDKIYTYRYIDKMTIEKISLLTSYSRSQTFRILRTIRNNLK